MVGIVLVSHSRQLAQGLVDLLGQLGGGDVRVRVAAGAPDGQLGTRAEDVAAAVLAADSGDGVVVLADLGSAVLSVKVALSDLDGAGAPGADAVLLADAPFVEGAVAAASLAGTGADLAAVLAAAEQARHIGKV